MEKLTHGVVFAAILVLTIVGVDLIFFRHHTLPRLLVNVGIVLVFLAFYWRFFKNS